jgi:hypothetical protein
MDIRIVIGSQTIELIFSEKRVTREWGNTLRSHGESPIPSRFFIIGLAFNECSWQRTAAQLIRSWTPMPKDADRDLLERSQEMLGWLA